MNESLSLTQDEEDENEPNSEKKKLTAENDPKIAKFRKYLRLAGLRIVKNSELDALKSKKARYDYLKKIFVDAGFKGKSLSIKTCKSFREKREREREIAELDVGNIIESTSGRATRNTTRSTRASKPQTKKKTLKFTKDSDSEDSSSCDDEDKSPNKKPKSNYDFSNMKDLIESDDESENEENRSSSKQVSTSSKRVLSDSSNSE